MSPLHVRSTDYLDCLYDLVGLLLKTLLNLLGDSQHRSGTEGVSCVNADWVDVLDEADSNHVVLRVTDNL